MGNRVKLPGASRSDPNVYEFGAATYESIYNDLQVRRTRRGAVGGAVGGLESLGCVDGAGRAAGGSGTAVLQKGQLIQFGTAQPAAPSTRYASFPTNPPTHRPTTRARAHPPTDTHPHSVTHPLATCSHPLPQAKDEALYTRNGLLQMLQRNMAIKPAPQRWQNHRRVGGILSFV